MWKCPNCETLNDTDTCIVCGEKKPLPGEEPLLYGKKMSDPSEDYDAFGKEDGNKNWILYLVIIILALFIIFGLMNNNSEAAEIDARYRSVVCESQIKDFSDAKSSIFAEKQVYYQGFVSNQYKNL